MILSGEKKEEYRALTDYWEKRLSKNGEVNEFETITFSNGMAKFPEKLRRFEVRFRGVYVDFGKKEWGAPDNEVFVFPLGEIVRRYNC